MRSKNKQTDIQRYLNKSDFVEPIHIEYRAAPHQIERMSARIKDIWSAYGQKEPYWSVITSDKFLLKNFHAHEDEFYQSGVGSYRLLPDALARNGITVEEHTRCLELGCGTGRVTCHLAKHFKAVYACDISADHLSLAEANLGNRGISNVEYHHTVIPDDMQRIPDVHVVYSIIVLQHNPPPLIAEYIRMLLNKLKPGGVAFFQVPTYRRDYSFSIETYLKNIQYDKHIMEMHAISQRGVFEIAMECGCMVREVREDGWTGDPNFISNTFLIQRP